MSTSITLPHSYQYVIASVVSVSWVLAGQTMLVTRARAKAGIKYPQLYAEKDDVEKSVDALKFNCTQRAHQNTLEVVPVLLVSTLVTGLKYPIFAASLCASWSLARIFFTRGYLTGDPGKRRNGGVASSIMLTTLFLTSTFVAGQFIHAGL